MELRQLKYFQMVSRFNSITKAAEEMHVAQPSVTIAIQKLEEELGVSLFDRTQKHISLTTEGILFLQRVEDILSRVHDTISEMNDCRRKRRSSIKIGIPPMIGVILFPHIFSEFRMLYPDIELNIIEEGSLGVLQLLEQGKLDIGFVVIFDRAANIETLPVANGQILACLPKDHPLGVLPAVPIEKLRHEPFILLKENTYNRQMIIEECQKKQYFPNIIFSTSQIQTIIDLVEKGVGISFLLDIVANKQINIISRPLAEPLTIQTGLAWQRGRYMSAALKDFIHFIEESFSSPKA